jgi:hypothetical protein
MTTNQTIEEINSVIEKAKNKDINIKIQYTISTSVNFLDVDIMNENGQLRTTIHHKPTAEPYYLPYTSDHPHRTHRNIPYNALLRAARLCSNVYDFNLERLRIDISLLLNGYPPNVITDQFLRFFQVHQAEFVFTHLNEQIYQQLHQNLLYKTTTTDIQFKDSKKKNPVLYPPVLQKKPWNRRVIYPCYTFESGPYMEFPHEFYDWWKQHYLYPGSPANKIQVRLTSTTNRTLRSLLIQKKPPREILTRLALSKN